MQRVYRFRAVLASILVVSFVITSCATIFKGSTEPISFASNPAGAEVFIDGMMMGRTPMQIELKSNKSYMIEFRMDGYLNRTVMLNNSISVGYLILDVLFGIIPVVVDAATGNWMSLDQSIVNAPLQTAAR